MNIIIDYNMGNIGSIINMIKKIGYAIELSDKRKNILTADKLILPGIGAFDNGMEELRSSGLSEILYEAVIDLKIPILGICLGMQLMMEKSEEGTLPGLGLIKGKVKKFIFDKKYKVPHMGWNEVTPVDSITLYKNLDNKPRFYFVHSYYIECAQKENILGISEYGIKFTSSVKKNNIYGVQFHPEKSHRFGMQLLKNFLELK